jgi:hypothetical protein
LLQLVVVAPLLLLLALLLKIACNLFGGGHESNNISPSFKRLLFFVLRSFWGKSLMIPIKVVPPQK